MNYILCLTFGQIGYVYKIQIASSLILKYANIFLLLL